MKEFNRDEVRAIFLRLPECVQDVYLSDEIQNSWKSAMDLTGLDVSTENELNRQFNQQVKLIMVGLATLRDFHEYLRDDLKLEPDLARAVEEIVARDVVGPIHQALLYSELVPGLST